MATLPHSTPPRVSSNAVLDGLPRLDPDREHYSMRDISQALGMAEASVRYHARNRFPNRCGWYRFSFEEATRLLKYIWRVRYQERQRAQVASLTQHLQGRGN